jgi:hypothetical protein
LVRKWKLNKEYAKELHVILLATSWSLWRMRNHPLEETWLICPP